MEKGLQQKLLVYLRFLVVIGVTVFSSPLSAGGRPWDMPEEEPISRFRLTNTVFSHISNYYVDFHNLIAVEVLRDALRAVEEVLPNLKIDISTGGVLVKLNGSLKVFDVAGIEIWLVLRERIKEIITFIESGGNCTLGLTELEYMALNGILSGFDPYSRVYRPEDLERIRSLGSGSFVGLGMEVELKEGYVTIVNLYKNTPAYRVGLQIGDRIIEIEGESARSMALTEALSRLNGPQGTSVTLSVWRDGQIHSFTVDRERIEVELAEWEVLEEGLGYIKLKSFQEGAFYSMVKAVRALEEAGGLKGLVLDLRNNYGGVMEEIIKVAELFLPSGVITIKTRTGEKLPEFITARPSERPEERCPIVILVDDGSASGAEILSSALRDNGRGLLVGARTFGKACIQQVFRFEGGYTLKLTTAKYFTPKGEYINLKGIPPDILFIPIKLEKDKTTLVHYARESLSGDKRSKAPGESPSGRVGVLCCLEKGGHGQDSPQKDLQVQLARGIFKAIPFKGEGAYSTITAQNWYDWLCHASNDVVKRYQEAEDKKIVRSLESMKIDWSIGPPEGLPNSIASLYIDKEEVEAGGTVTLTASVENRGEFPIYRVLARADSGNPIFNGLEFPIGRVRPGERAQYSLKVKVPEDSFDRQDEIVLRFTEGNGFPPTDVVQWITVWAHPTPLFACDYSLLQPQAGQQAELFLRVKNIGQGTSNKNVVVLKGAGIKILQGRQELGMLRPGEEKVVKLTFTPLDVVQKNKYNLRILITDLVLGTQLPVRLTLSEGAAHEVSCQPPVISLQKAVLVANEGFVDLAFVAKDDRGLQGACVAVNDRKVFFGYNPQASPEYTFSPILHINRGPNLVKIIAYDEQGLSSEKAFIITGR